MENLETTKVTIKLKQVVEAVEERFSTELKEQVAKINKNARLEEVVSQDNLIAIYRKLQKDYPRFEDNFEANIQERIREIKPAYKEYRSWQDLTTIQNRIIEFTMNNSEYTFEQLYNYATETLTKNKI